MERTDKQIYEEFTSQLAEWAKNGTIPTAGNQDIGYALNLQKQRMERHNIHMDYQLNLRGERSDNISDGEFRDEKYTNKLVWRAYERQVDYYKEGRRCLTVKDNELLYTIITWLNNPDTQTTCCCPNCGAISEVHELLEGCPYCRTKFLMTDLFPKVTNFYFFRDYALGGEEAKRNVRKWMLCGGLAGMALMFPGQFKEFLQGGWFFPIFLVLLGGTLGAVMGYFAYSLSLFFRVMKDAVRQAPMAVGQMGAKSKLTEFMRRYDPGFSFEYFLGKVQGLMKIFIYSDDRSRLSVYRGKEEPEGFDHIVDAQYGGAISLNACQVDGAYCYLDLNVHMTNVYCQGGRVYQRQEKFQMGLGRNISRPADYGFSIKKVTCKNCGASFDASTERQCPYCQSDYDLIEDDWVITFIRRI